MWADARSQLIGKPGEWRREGVGDRERACSLHAHPTGLSVDGKKGWDGCVKIVVLGGLARCLALDQSLLLDAGMSDLETSNDSVVSHLRIFSPMFHSIPSNKTTC